MDIVLHHEGAARQRHLAVLRVATALETVVIATAIASTVIGDPATSPRDREGVSA